MNKKIAALTSGGAILGVGIVLAMSVYSQRESSNAETTPVQSATSAQNSSTMQGFGATWAGASANTSVPSKPRISPQASHSAQRALEMESARDVRTKALADPANLRVLIQQYFTERDPEARRRLKALLSTINKPEIIEVAKQLIATGDPEKRQDGVELIQRQTINSPEARSLIKQVLADERSPAVLLQALYALKPVAVDSIEEQDIIAQLLNLSQNSDAAVRKQSILSLALWSRHGEAVDRLTQALTDPAPEVRQAATFALAKINARLNRANPTPVSIANQNTQTTQ